MARKISPVIALIFLYNLIATRYLTIVKGDDQLINSVCTKTLEPKECHECFNSNPRSRDMTLRELAGTSIFCAYNQTSIAQQLFAHYASDKTQHPIMRQAFDFCTAKSDSSAEKLTIALSKWGENNVAEAKNQINLAKVDYNVCTSDLTQSAERAKQPDAPVDLGIAYTKMGVLMFLARDVVSQVG